MNFDSVRDFISNFTEMLLQYEIENGVSPEYAYIPVEDFDRLILLMKNDHDISPRYVANTMATYLDMMRYRYLFVYGVKCYRSYVAEFNFSSPRRPEYGMYQGKP